MSFSARSVIAVITSVVVRRLIVVKINTSRGGIFIPKTSSSLTLAAVSTGISRFLARCCVQRALVSACIIFVSARAFI